MGYFWFKGISLLTYDLAYIIYSTILYFYSYLFLFKICLYIVPFIIILQIRRLRLDSGLSTNPSLIHGAIFNLFMYIFIICYIPIYFDDGNKLNTEY